MPRPGSKMVLKQRPERMTSGTPILAASPDSGTAHPVLPVPVQPNLSVEGLGQIPREATSEARTRGGPGRPAPRTDAPPHPDTTPTRQHRSIPETGSGDHQTRELDCREVLYPGRDLLLIPGGGNKAGRGRRETEGSRPGSGPPHGPTSGSHQTQGVVLCARRDHIKHAQPQSAARTATR